MAILSHKQSNQALTEAHMSLVENGTRFYAPAYLEHLFGYDPQQKERAENIETRFVKMYDNVLGYFRGTIDAQSLAEYFKNENIAFNTSVNRKSDPLAVAPAFLDGISAWADTCDAARPHEDLLKEITGYLVPVWPFPVFRGDLGQLREDYDLYSLTLIFLSGSIFPETKKTLQTALVSSVEKKLSVLEQRVEDAGLSLPSKVDNPRRRALDFTAFTGNVAVYDVLKGPLSGHDFSRHLAAVSAMEGHPHYTIHVLQARASTPSQYISALTPALGVDNESNLFRIECENLKSIRALAREIAQFDEDHRLVGSSTSRVLMEHNKVDSLRILIEENLELDSSYKEGLQKALCLGHLGIIELFASAAESGQLNLGLLGKYPDSPKTPIEQLTASLRAADGANVRFETPQRNTEYVKFHFRDDDHALLDILEKNGIQIIPRSQNSRETYDANYERYVAKNRVPFGCIRYNLHNNLEKLNYNFYLQVLTALDFEGYNAHAPLAQNLAYKACALFKKPEVLAGYLLHYGKAGYTPLHDVLQAIDLDQSLILPFESVEAETLQARRQSMLMAWREAAMTAGPKMLELLNQANLTNGLVPAKNDRGIYTVKETRRAIGAMAFPENPDLGELAMDMGATREQMTEAQKLIETKMKAAANDNAREAYLPDIVIDGSDYGMPGTRFRKMDIDDVRGPFLGAFTQCCQRITHDGGKIAIEHAYNTPYSWFYIVEDVQTEKILGHSWAWRGQGKGQILFENAERRGEDKGETVPEEAWKKLFAMLPCVIAQDPRARVAGIRKIHVGQSTKMPDLTDIQDVNGQPVFEVATRCIRPRDYDKNGYRESEEQYVTVLALK